MPIKNPVDALNRKDPITTPRHQAPTPGFRPAANAATRPETPFGAALKAARLITSRTPSEEQPKEHNQLQTAMAALDESGQHGIVSVLQREVLERNSPVQPLFAAARLAQVVWPNNGRSGNLLAVARGTVAVRNAMNAGLTTDDMAEVGLAVLAPSGDKLNYRVGVEAIKTAIAKLEGKQDKEGARKVLADYLAKGEEIRQGHAREQARQNTIARLRTAKPAAPATPDTQNPTPDA